MGYLSKAEYKVTVKLPLIVVSILILLIVWRLLYGIIPLNFIPACAISFLFLATPCIIDHPLSIIGKCSLESHLFNIYLIQLTSIAFDWTGPLLYLLLLLLCITFSLSVHSFVMLLENKFLNFNKVLEN